MPDERPAEAAQETPSVTPPGATPDDAVAPTHHIRSWSSDELLGEDTEVLIIHGEHCYRLRKTRSGKLILYK